MKAKKTTQSIQSQISALLKEISKGLYERDEAISLAFLSAIAGESIFLLGLPGVAKSLIGRRLKLAFHDATAFEYLMSRFSTPDEIFGPVSISKLKEEDTYERVVQGYLPTANIVFLDEIWKAGPSIQNSLLTVLNEKIYHNGQYDIKLPLKGIIAASNELPTKNEGLEALWDRFLIRMIVSEIKNRKSFDEMICSTSAIEIDVDKSLKITEKQYSLLQTEINSISIPPYILDAIHYIRTAIIALNARTPESEEEEELSKIIISDRRWKKIIRLLRTSALLNGRQCVDISDLHIISYCLWDEDNQIEHINAIVDQAVIVSCFPDYSALMEEIKEQTNKLNKLKNEPAIYENQYYNIKNYSPGKTYISIDLYDSISEKFKKKIAINMRNCNTGDITITTDFYSQNNYKTSILKSKNENAVIIDQMEYFLEGKYDTQQEFGNDISHYIQEREVSLDKFKNKVSDLKDLLKRNIFCFNYKNLIRELNRAEIRLRKN